jgi:hypothetical protein
MTMHFPTPHITKKSEKRKASLNLGVGDDEIAIEEKITKTKSKKKTKKAKKAKVSRDENMYTSRQTSPSLPRSRTASLRKDSAQDPYVIHPIHHYLQLTPTLSQTYNTPKHHHHHHHHHNRKRTNTNNSRIRSTCTPPKLADQEFNARCGRYMDEMQTVY